VRLKTSSGPRRVRYEETKEPGYLDEPQLKEIFYINSDSDKGNMEKMEVKLTQSLAGTKVTAQLKQKNHSEVTYSRFKAYTPKDIKKKEFKDLLRLYSNGELGEDAQQQSKITAIWGTQVKLLEQIAKKVTNNASDHTDVYFIVEDDIAFVHDQREMKQKTDWIEQAMCHISKLPADWDMYKFGYWTESLQRRPEGSCGSAKSFNEFSCQQRDTTAEGQWEIMGNQAYAVRPQGAANMLRYLRSKMVMDVDGAMVPMAWQPINQPIYYNSRVPLVWHHAPHTHNLYNFLQRRSNFDAEPKEQEEETPAESEEEFHKETMNLLLKKKTTAKKADIKLEAWYVNMAKSKSRKKCIERQLAEQGLSPNRYEAVIWPKTCSGNTMCLQKKSSGVADCVEGGIAWGGVAQHGTGKDLEEKVGVIQSGVLANWCSHKRLFEQLQREKLGDNTTNAEEEYILIFEDDVVLHKDFKDRVVKFIQEYDGKLNDGRKMNWMSVQIDPFGQTGHHLGKFDEGVISVPDKTHGEWYGMHAWLVKKSALPKITKWMSEHKAIPIDWIPKRMSNFLAWKPHIAENPEVVHSGGHVHLPAYCDKDSMFHSEISGKQVYG
jgi:GR25 family glycosyltransferase involved in LPS biosynthesis